MKRTTKILTYRVGIWFAWLLGQLPANLLIGLLTNTVARRASSLQVTESLRFLFRLDAALYTLEGRTAVEYDGGVHTKHRHTKYHEFFVNRIQKGERVVDIGCGAGEVAYEVANRVGTTVVGIDLSEDNIAKALHNRNHTLIEYRVGDALRMSDERSFDVVILSNVLEHLPDRSVFLRQLQQSTGAKRFLIRVPLFERDWRVPLKREVGVEWRLDSTHETEYTVESFADEIEDAKFTIVHQQVRWGELWAEAVPLG